MRLIDADALKEKLSTLWDRHDDQEFADKDIWRELENAPTIEERKTGAWISDGVRFKGGHEWMHCSECGLETLDTPLKRTNYCPNCGSRMEK